MSHHTQRATKYIFSTVTQLSENLWSPRAAAAHTTTAWREVIPYVKPVFTAINTVATILTRYTAVFPLTDDQLFQRHARGQRSEDFPHAYQMVLF